MLTTVLVSVSLLCASMGQGLQKYIVFSGPLSGWRSVYTSAGMGLILYGLGHCQPTTVVCVNEDSWYIT